MNEMEMKEERVARPLRLGEKVKFIGTHERHSSTRMGNHRTNKRVRKHRFCLKNVSVGDVKLSHIWITMQKDGRWEFQDGDVVAGTAEVVLYPFTRADGTIDFTFKILSMRKLEAK